MVFNSIHFGIFFMLVWSGAMLLRKHVGPRNFLLLVASYYFYGCWDWRFLSLLMISTFVDYSAGMLMGQSSPGAPRAPRARALLMCSVLVNLGLLGFFKYYGFFAESAVAMLRGIGFHAHLPTLQIILPVGISFYTFQTLSYTIDVYMGRIAPERNLLTFAVYVAFFPQLVAGPIERAGNLLPQFNRPAQIDFSLISSGTYLICSGLFKKVVVADNAAHIVQTAFDLRNPDAWSVVLGTYAFCVQVYCDFSGYSDIARGAARWMGFELMKNFNQPYLATNPSDFWSRWHISLSTWIRDYIYFPLGGSRRGRLRTYFNLVTVMVLCGLWHGAAWIYVAYGALQGTLLSIHHALRPWMARNLNFQGRIATPLWKATRVVLFFQVTAFGMMLFRCSSFAQFGRMLAGLTRGWRVRELLADPSTLYVVLGSSLLLLVVQFVKEVRKDAYFILRLPVPARAVIYAAGLLCFLAFGEFYGEPFIYFQF